MGFLQKVSIMAPEILVQSIHVILVLELKNMSKHVGMLDEEVVDCKFFAF